MSERQAKHVVLIVFDYMGYGDIEPYGSCEIRTPNIKRLAEEGRRYTDFYAPSPICVPSRAAMLTGKYPRRLGIENNIYHGEPGLSVSETSLARHFKSAGFQNALFGKWHLGYEEADSPNAHGFDEFLGFHEWNIDYYSHKTRDGDPALYRDREIVEVEGYTTDLFTDGAVDFIARNAERPFFLYVGYNAGLPPYRPPGREAELSSRDTWENGDRADYVAMVEHLDLSVGRILESLDAAGLRDDTVIALTYDHGGAELATKGGFFHGFGTLWEGGIRVPLILNQPGVIQPAVVDNPAILMDMTPTLLSAAGLDAGGGLDGVDLLDPASSETERTLYWRIDLPTLREDWRARAQRAVRKGPWKYVWDGGFEFLFDITKDPGERENIGMHHPERVAEMRALAKGDW